MCVKLKLEISILTNACSIAQLSSVSIIFTVYPHKPPTSSQFSCCHAHAPHFKSDKLIYDTPAFLFLFLNFPLNEIVFVCCRVSHKINGM